MSEGPFSRSELVTFPPGEIKRIRESQGITLEGLAAKAGVTTGTYRRAEEGVPVSVDVARLIKTALPSLSWEPPRSAPDPPSVVAPSIGGRKWVGRLPDESDPNSLAAIEAEMEGRHAIIRHEGEVALLRQKIERLELDLGKRVEKRSGRKWFWGGVVALALLCSLYILFDHSRPSYTSAIVPPVKVSPPSDQSIVRPNIDSELAAVRAAQANDHAALDKAKLELENAQQSIEQMKRQLATAMSGAPAPSPQTLDEALAHLPTANVAFNTPDKARVGKSFIVEAKISTSLKPIDLQILISEAGKIEVGTLKVSDRMVGSLSGGSAFVVTPNIPIEQGISYTDTTNWTWQVTPTSRGEQLLILSFDALIDVNGKQTRRTINTFKRHINVDVSWPETVGEWLELIKKTGENISWIWLTVLIPVGGAVWALVKRLWRPSKPDDAEDTSG
jgi:transcriptional regulator with XRE-family HTH domain